MIRKYILTGTMIIAAAIASKAEDKPSVTPDEGNPSAIVFNDNSAVFSFTVTGIPNPQPAEFYGRIYDSEDNIVGYGPVLEKTDIETGVCRVSLNYSISGSEDSPTDGYILRLLYLNEAVYSEPVKAMYVPLESVSFPKELEITEGYFKKVDVIRNPEICSESIQYTVNGDNLPCFSKSTSDPTLYLFPNEPGASEIEVINNKTGEGYGEIKVTMTPREYATYPYTQSVKIKTGDSIKLGLSNATSGESYSVPWSSLNPDIAEVDAYGYVTGLKDGVALMKASGGSSTNYLALVVGNGAGITDTEADTNRTAHVYSTEGTIFIEGAAPGSPVNVYSADGHMAGKCETDPDGRAAMSVAPGIYVLTLADRVVKISV